MNGRAESDKKYEELIIKKLSGCSDVLKRYSLDISRHTASTRYYYILHVSDFLDYLEKNGKDVNDSEIFKNIRKSDVNEYLESVRYRKMKNDETGEISQVELGASFQARRIFAISSFFNYLVQDEIIMKNPCENIEKPKEKVEKEIVYMTKEDLNKVISNIKNGVGNHMAREKQKEWRSRDLAILMLGCTTGLRVSSIREINLKDIDFEENYVLVTEKGNKTRKCYFGDSVSKLLQKWIGDRDVLMRGHENCDALFVSSRRSRISTKGIEEMISKYSVGLSRRITPHKMRSTCAMNLYDKTGDIYLVAEVLGHKNIDNTKKYAKATAERRKKAAVLMDRIYS